VPSQQRHQSGIERGPSEPGLTSRARIADALGVSLAELGAALDGRRKAPEGR
jgi:transcriptional regulator with XRE-family HTH domain